MLMLCSLFRDCLAHFSFNLPKDQDCHEMWCKQKRRKEREAQQMAAKKLKSEMMAEAGGGAALDNTDMAMEPKEIPSPLPPSRHLPKDKSLLLNSKPHPGSLSVPLPTAPALNTSILESLSGSSSTNLLMKNTHLDELTQITAQLQQLQSHEQSNKEIQQPISQSDWKAVQDVATIRF